MLTAMESKYALIKMADVILLENYFNLNCTQQLNLVSHLPYLILLIDLIVNPGFLMCLPSPFHNSDITMETFKSILHKCLLSTQYVSTLYSLHLEPKLIL